MNYSYPYLCDYCKPPLYGVTAHPLDVASEANGRNVDKIILFVLCVYIVMMNCYDDVYFYNN